MAKKKEAGTKTIKYVPQIGDVVVAHICPPYSVYHSTAAGAAITEGSKYIVLDCDKRVSDGSDEYSIVINDDNDDQTWWWIEVDGFVWFEKV